MLLQKRSVFQLPHPSASTNLPITWHNLWRFLLGGALTRHQGLIQVEERHGFEGDGYVYLRNPLWWAGIATREYLLLTARLTAVLTED